MALTYEKGSKEAPQNLTSRVQGASNGCHTHPVIIPIGKALQNLRKGGNRITHSRRILAKALSYAKIGLSAI